jgi:hypothetical protein
MNARTLMMYREFDEGLNFVYASWCLVARRTPIECVSLLYPQRLISNKNIAILELELAICEIH